MSTDIEFKEQTEIYATGEAPESVDGVDFVTGSCNEGCLSPEEVNELVKKQLESSSAQYCEMEAEQIIEMFDDLRDKGLDLSKFDYRIYTRDYYAEKFPGFDPRFYECLEKASHEKFADMTEKKEDSPNFTREDGDFVISFGSPELTDKNVDNK